MPLPTSGTITMAQINAEFGRGNNLNAYRGTQWYTAAGGSGTFPTGAISFSDFYGKQLASPSFNFTISSHQNQANLRTLAVNAGWNQSSPVTATIASGIYIYSTDIGTPALTINGSFPGGVTLVNNGYVMGMGGQGGGIYIVGSNNVLNNQGISAGGPAISLGVSCTIQNNSYIGGGGGGGGSVTAGIVAAAISSGYAGGGGAGGGAGGYYNNAGTITYGGAGGGIGSSGAAGPGGTPAAGGGRIMPGSNTTATGTGGTPTATISSTGGGAGNAGSASASGAPTSGTGSIVVSIGGSGGGTGTGYVGYAYGSYAHIGGGGGGWGASGGTSAKSTGFGTTAGGAAGGFCVITNGYGITWSATGTRYGSIG